MWFSISDIKKMLRFFEKHSAFSWLITIFGAIAIFYISSLRLGRGTAGTNVLAIIYHLTAFFLFALFLLISLVKGRDKSFIFIIGITAATLYGFSDEIHQLYVPGRTSSLFDVFLDATGILFASVIYLAKIKLK